MGRRIALAFAATLIAAGACTKEDHRTGDRAEDNPAFYDSEEKGGETYAEYDSRRDDLEDSAGTYGDFGCTEDCSGHEAGYAWAENHDIEDPDDCGGKSWSFEEGCREYAEDYYGEDESDSDDDY